MTGSDYFGYNLLSATVSTNRGTTIFDANEATSQNISMDDQENMSFELKSGTVLGNATVRAWSIYRTLEGVVTNGEVTIELSPVVAE